MARQQAGLAVSDMLSRFVGGPPANRQVQRFQVVRRITDTVPVVGRWDWISQHRTRDVALAARCAPGLEVFDVLESKFLEKG
jgi:hypothetical protein